MDRDDPGLQKRLKNLKNFKPGQKANPRGGSSKQRHKNALSKYCKELTPENLALLGKEMLIGTHEDLKNVANSPEAPMIKRWLASVIVKGVQNGDISSLNQVLDRLVGKVTENIQVQLPIPTIIHRLNGVEVEMSAELEKDDE